MSSGEIKDNRLALFQAEVEMQCRFIRKAGMDLQAPDGSPGRGATWYAAQQLLVAAAIASTLLWGNTPQKKADRERLRQTLGVTDASPLKPRAVRNGFAHIDDRIGTWADGQRGVTVRNHIGPPSALPDAAPYRLFRHYDPATGVLGFGNNRVNVKELLAEAEVVIEHWRELNPFMTAAREGRADEWLEAFRQASPEERERLMPW